MKKLLVFALSVILVATVFTACSEQKEATPKETTTISIDKVNIENGEIKGGRYVNKSLDFKIYCPIDYNIQDGGDVVITPDTKELPDYDFYIIKTENDKSKSLSVSIENTEFKSADEWANEQKKATAEKKTNIGNMEYTVVSTKSKVKFAAVKDGKIVLITFSGFDYDGALNFIQEYFRYIVTAGFLLPLFHIFSKFYEY